MTTPLVSVVIPVIDPHPEYFPEAVQSVLAQTWTDFELVVIEDPSDSSATKLLPKSEPRIRHIRNNSRTSFAAQLNQGVAIAQGELIARLDADDVCEPDRLAKQVAFLREHPEVDVLGSQLLIVDGSGVRVGFREYPTHHESIVRCLRRYNSIAHPAVMFTRAAVERGGPYEPANCYGIEDYELWCRWAKLGLRFANHSEALVQYRIHPEAMKAAGLTRLLHGTLDVKRQHWQGKMNLGDRARMSMEQALLCLPPKFVFWMFVKTQLRSSLSPRA